MKTSSAKAKGRRLQDRTANVLLDYYAREHSLVRDDVRPAIMGMSGADIILSPLAKSIIPFDVECKNTERLNLWGAIKQAESNSKESRIPLVVFSRNHSKVYACLEFDKFMEIICIKNKPKNLKKISSE